jgi:TusE/DsrC/DsvC family sulfur relay protein
MKNEYHMLFDNHKISTDDEGFLLYTDDWSPEMGSHIASDIGIDMSDEHWEAVHFIREQFETNCSVPELRKFLKFLRNLHGKERATRRYVYDLFPYGYGQQACKIAGMRKPLKLMLDL